METVQITNGSFPGPQPVDVNDSPELRAKVWRSLLIWFIVAICMGFAAFTSAYIVSKSNNFWVNFDLPSSFTFSTIIIMVCSGVAQLSLWAANKGNQKLLRIGMILTLIVSLIFATSQWNGWGQMVQMGNYFSSDIEAIQGEYGTDFTITYNNIELILEDGKYYLPQDELRKQPLNSRLLQAGNTASSYVYIMSGVHLLHVALGLILLGIVFVKALRGRYGVEYNSGVKLTTYYWHFLGLLWIYLFLFLTFIH